MTDPSEMPARHLPLDGASNFRDFGGYSTRSGGRVKWRRLFRSDRLSELSQNDHARLAPLGIKLVFDLRRDSEAEAEPPRWPGSDAPEFVRAPLLSDNGLPGMLMRVMSDAEVRNDPRATRGLMAHLYEHLVTDGAACSMLGAVIARMASPGGAPALVHCAAGKDRTGVACALVQEALGVSREDVMADFLLTRAYYDAGGQRMQRVGQMAAAAGLTDWSEEALAALFSVEAEYLERALSVVDEAGGAERFLVERCGVAADVTARMRADFTE
jgi:protein-tyrosine phosphatase